LTNECGNKLKHENEAEGLRGALALFVFKLISTFIGQNPKLFFMHVLTKDVLLL
jgi:hypothetical protein